MAVLVLAGSLREANAYGQEKGFRVRFATGPEVIQAASHIVELPSFRLRRDRFTMNHALNSRLQYGKGVEYVFEEDWQWTPPRPADAAIKPENDEKSRRYRLITAANDSVDKLAIDLGVTPVELLETLLAERLHINEPPQEEQLPLEDPEPEMVEIPIEVIPESTPEPEMVETPIEVIPEPTPVTDPVKKAAPPRKRAAKKAASKPADTAVEF